MNEQIFPPSPNWYLNNILSCKSNNLIAYGSRVNIVLLEKKDDNLEISIIPSAHKERVTAVVFSTCEDRLANCLVSTGEDCFVRLWNLNTLTAIQAHTGHKENQVVGLDWSRADSKFVMSVDEASSIVCWDLHQNSTTRVFVGKLQPTCLACCPHKKEIIAVGTKGGLVCIINVKGTGRLIYRLRGHDSDVVSLSWCPVKNNVFHDDSDENDFLLASGSKHRSVYVWRTGGDGRYEAVLNVPSLLAGIQSRQSASEGNWVCVYWAEPHLLLAGTKSGRLICWDLKNFHSRNKTKRDGDASSQVCRVIHSSHNRVLYCISSPPVNLEVDKEDNWSRPVGRRLVWSISQDRLLVAYDLHSDQVMSTIPTIGGIVYCIAVSSIDPNRVAIGAGDAVIRIWNLSSQDPYEMLCLWHKIKGKVTTLAWHPTKENCLAFGTAEGRVGLLDVSSSKPPVLLRPYHCHSLYTLCWGPPLFNKGAGDGDCEVKYALYSCGDGAIVQYNHNKPDEEARDLKDVAGFSNPSKKKEGRCDLAWKHDNSLLAVGNDDGTVQVFSVSPLKALCLLYAHKKLIHKLAWHPEGTATDAGYSPYQHWLAVASKDNPVKVYDLSCVAEGDPEVQPNQVPCVATLTGHLSGVLSLCWSPHIGGQLVSVAYDETAQVWDVPKQTPLANCSLHSGFVYSCAWSPVDPTLVMTGSADFTLRVWRISRLTNKLPVDKKKLRKVEKKNMKPLEVAQPDSDLPVAKEESAPSNVVVQDVELASHERGENTSKKAARSRSFFPVSSKVWVQGRKLNLEQCQSVLATGSSGPSFFKDRSALLQLLEQEEEYHVAAGNLEYAQHMGLWKGNLNDTLKEAIRKKQLSDWLVSLAPMVSARLWKEACLAYAEQLIAECNYHKASSYLLASHMVNEAIELLLERKLFREAITIAKCRLSPDDPIVGRICKAWVQQLASDGQFEVAAECLVARGELEVAAELLARRDDERSLRLAVDVARKADKNNLASSLALRCICTSLLHKNWDVAFELVEDYEDLKHFTVLISVHKLVTELACQDKPPAVPLLTLLRQTLEDGYSDNLEDTYSLLEKSLEKTPVHNSEDKLWLCVSGELSLSCCSSSATTSLRHLVAAASSCYQYQMLQANTNPLYRLMTWLVPGDPFQGNGIFKKNYGCAEENELVKSLRCYLFASLFHKLQDGCVEETAELVTPACTEYVAGLEDDVDILVFYRDQLEIKKCEQEVATNLAKGRLTSSTDDKAVQLLEKLELLKKRKEGFEERRHSAPNPFVTYCLFRTVCSLISNGNEGVLQEGEKCWSKLESAVKEMY